MVDEKFEANDGRLACVALSNDHHSVIAINAYAPNDHNIQFFETVFEKLIYFKDKYPLHEVILAGDFNLVMEKEKDSINRAVSTLENISRNLVKNNLSVLGLLDAYRKCEENKGYTWTRGNIYSRLDYVFLSDQLIQNTCNAKIDWTFDRSDHAAVKIRIEVPSLSLKVLIRSIMSEISGKNKKIEDVEFKATCEQLNRLKNNYADCLKNNIEVNNIRETIAELENIVEIEQKKKAQQLAEMANCKWFDEGEKSNKYFLNLLKRRSNESIIKSISDGQNTAESQTEIEKLIRDFYGKLYDVDQTLKNDYDDFFPVLPQLDERDREGLDRPITLEEMWITLKDCKESSPGPDGIPYSIYKECWEVFGPVILESWEFSKTKGLLPDYNRTSTIKLIPKEGKDPKLVSNWRPITLTNCDLKIITKLYSNRVAKVLPKIIIETQVAYIPGRSVHDNLRMFEFYSSYCKKNNVDAIMLSLDAAKAFDSVDHNYMFETLRRYGFSDEFISVVRLLYEDIKAEILVNGFKTTMIRIRRCVKQGMP